MTVLRDNIWLWGQTPGAHHAESNNRYQLPGVNRMTPAEGCDFLGIPNCCRIVMENSPAPPFDSESEALKHLSKVVWSVVGSGGSSRNDCACGDLEEVLRQARNYPNVAGGALDDFLNVRRRDLFRPEDVAAIRRRLHGEAGRQLDLWVVLYEGELTAPVAPYLAECDVITFWTWCSSHLFEVERNFKKVVELSPGKRRLAGCYMWNYGESKELSVEAMEFQLSHYLDLYRRGVIEGIVFCSNCIADLGIPAVDYTRQWIADHADEPFGGYKI